MKTIKAPVTPNDIVNIELILSYIDNISSMQYLFKQDLIKRLKSTIKSIENEISLAANKEDIALWTEYVQEHIKIYKKIEDINTHK